MKHLKEQLNESQMINESIFSSMDVSMAIILTSVLSSLVTMGFAITGRVINGLIAATNRDKQRIKRNELLMKLKELTRSIPDIDDKPAIAVMNNPGEWDSIMIDELKRAILSKMSEDQIAEFEQLLKEYLKKHTLINSIK